MKTDQIAKYLITVMLRRLSLPLCVPAFLNSGEPVLLGKQLYHWDCNKLGEKMFFHLLIDGIE